MYYSLSSNFYVRYIDLAIYQGQIHISVACAFFKSLGEPVIHPTAILLVIFNMCLQSHTIFKYRQICSAQLRSTRMTKQRKIEQSKSNDVIIISALRFPRSSLHIDRFLFWML